MALIRKTTDSGLQQTYKSYSYLTMLSPDTTNSPYAKGKLKAYQPSTAHKPAHIPAICGKTMAHSKEY
jgi:hypothetical protein